MDIAIEVAAFKYYFQGVLHKSSNMEHMKENIISILKENTLIEEILFSSNPTEI